MARYKQLPQWSGTNMVARFGFKMVPAKSFSQEQLLTVVVSILAADKTMQPRRLLEVPQLPGPGGKVNKVWVGPERNLLYTFAPLLTRAAHAELTVNVMLGAWSKKCVLSLSDGGRGLSDIRKVIESYCFGRDLSEARFVRRNGEAIHVGDEATVDVNTLRPSVGLWGNARRQGAPQQCNVLISYSPDTKAVASQALDSLIAKGYPAWMDRQNHGSSQGLSEAGLFVAFLTRSYNDDADAIREYSDAVQKGLRALLVWPHGIFPLTGQLKGILKEQESPENHQAHRHPLHIYGDVAEGSRLPQHLLEQIALSVAHILPAPPPPVIFHKRMPAPYSAPPTVSALERKQNAPPINVGPYIAEMEKKAAQKKAEEKAKEKAAAGKDGKGKAAPKKKK